MELTSEMYNYFNEVNAYCTEIGISENNLWIKPLVFFYYWESNCK